MIAKKRSRRPAQDDGEPMVVIPTRLPKSLAAWYAARAHERGLRLSSYIRSVLTQHKNQTKE